MALSNYKSTNIYHNTILIISVNSNTVSIAYRSMAERKIWKSSKLLIIISYMYYIMQIIYIWHLTI